jgi:hypothetical protein
MGNTIPCPYGENLAELDASTTKIISPDVFATKAVASWYNEKNSYSYSNPVFAESTGHFTQLIWVGTTTMGCGYATGPTTLSNGSPGTAYYAVCRYSPAGNVTGQFPANVPPPNAATSASIFHFSPLPANHSLSEALDLIDVANTAISKQDQSPTL